MLDTHSIGMFCLNIAFIFYLFLFLPQIWHNRDKKNIQSLSNTMHMVLYFGVLFDLFYGFSGNFQWQYKTVSIVSLIVLSAQHYQLSARAYHANQYSQVTINIASTLLMLSSILYFFIALNHTLSAFSFLLVGTISRICYQVYAMPQLLKNIRLKNANAISSNFILMNMTVLILDTIAGWCLDWGWPAKLSPPISLTIMAILLYQKRTLKSTPAFSG